MTRLDIVVVTIASKTRPHFWRAQNKTWGRALGATAFIPVLEADVEPCSLCAQPNNNRLRSKRPKIYTAAYQCAQQRPIQAIRIAIQRHRNAGWYLVVDDDTWVDALSVRELLLRVGTWRKRRPAAIGCVYANDADKYTSNRTRRLRSNVMVLGGAGYLLHGPSVLRMLHTKPAQKVLWPAAAASAVHGNVRVIDACVRNTLGGAWCWWNSDWAVSECLAMVGLTPVHHWGFTQWAHKCDRTAITCHHMNDERQHELTTSRTTLHAREPVNAARWSARTNGTAFEHHLSFRWEWVNTLTIERAPTAAIGAELRQFRSRAGDRKETA